MNTGGLHYMRYIGAKKLESHITNLHIKRPGMNVNWGKRSREIVNLKLQILEFADKKKPHTTRSI